MKDSLTPTITELPTVKDQGRELTEAEKAELKRQRELAEVSESLAAEKLGLPTISAAEARENLTIAAAIFRDLATGETSVLHEPTPDSLAELDSGLAESGVSMGRRRELYDRLTHSDGMEVDGDYLTSLVGFNKLFGIRDLDPNSSTVDSVGGQCGALAIHELQRLIGGDFYSVMLMFADEDPDSGKRFDPVFVQKLVEDLGLSVDLVLQKAVNLIEVIQNGIEHNGLLAGRVTEETLLKTIEDPSSSVDIKFAGPIEFATLEEFLSVRTLIHNAVKESPPGAKVRVEFANVNGRRVFRIYDSAIDTRDDQNRKEVENKAAPGRWSNAAQHELGEYISQGFESPTTPYTTLAGGTKMIAYRTGQEQAHVLAKLQAEARAKLPETAQRETETVELPMEIPESMLREYKLENGTTEKAVMLAFPEVEL